jgi:DnaD-like protein
MPNIKQDKTKIVQIWGEILDEGFTSVPNILLRYRSQIGLKPKHIMLIIDIMSFKWDRGSPFPSYSTLSLRGGVEERSIKRITQDLEELGLLVKTPRFDEDTGAQVTTVFDFRPLVQKLIDEMNKDQEREEGVSVNKEDFRLENEGVLKKSKPKKPINKGQKRGDKNVMGGGDKNVTRRVTETAPGGVTKMSPKEYTYRNKNNNVLTLENNSTYSRGKKSNGSEAKKTKERVSKYFRDSIFRNRIFEVYDNLVDLKTLEELVEEGAYRASKDVLVNRAKDFDNNEVNIKPGKISKIARKEFPYSEMPGRKTEARKFYTAAICNIVSDLVSKAISQKGN